MKNGFQSACDPAPARTYKREVQTYILLDTEEGAGCESDTVIVNGPFGHLPDGVSEDVAGDEITRITGILTLPLSGGADACLDEETETPIPQTLTGPGWIYIRAEVSDEVTNDALIACLIGALNYPSPTISPISEFFNYSQWDGGNKDGTDLIAYLSKKFRFTHPIPKVGNGKNYSVFFDSNDMDFCFSQVSGFRILQPKYFPIGTTLSVTIDPASDSGYASKDSCPYVPVTATATADVDGGGNLVLTLTNGGQFYTRFPKVTINGVEGIAQALLSGSTAHSYVWDGIRPSGYVESDNTTWPKSDEFIFEPALVAGESHLIIVGNFRYQCKS